MSTSVSRETSEEDGPCKPGDYKLENFDLIKTIGTGTFARVSLARDKLTRDYFALKVLAIQDILKLKQVDHVKNEKMILSKISHPFLIKLLWTNKDRQYLYMLFPFICGGELFSYLRSSGRFSPGATLFYSAEIVSCLEYLHDLNIVYRDLKPENLLIDREGHLKIVDFGFSKEVTDRTWTLCGTPEYLAPEIIQAKGHNKAVDWWALGILIYEMLAGYPPFFDDNPFSIYEKILAGRVEWPAHLDPTARDIIRRLLVQDRNKRLGTSKTGTEDVKKHRYFRSVDWQQVYLRSMKPPRVPKVSYEGDSRNFDDYPETDWRLPPSTISERDIRRFDDF